MILLYVVFALLALLLMYLLFLGVCCLLVNPEKEYDKNSPFYRFLLDSATAASMKLLRIRVHVSGIEKIPKDTKVLFVSNHRSNFDPIITWYILKKMEDRLCFQAQQLQDPVLWADHPQVLLYAH